MTAKKTEAIQKWGIADKRVCALLLVGSYARGEQRPDSDMDLVIVTDDKESLFELDWIEVYGKAVRSAREEYGVCTSIRVFYEDGTEIEYGIVNRSWLSRPLDPGTERVLTDGYKLLYGQDGIDEDEIRLLLYEGKADQQK